MGNISRSFYNDLRHARKAQHDESLPIVICRLTKAGVPSKMADATRRFATLELANEYMRTVADLNPGVRMQWQVTDTRSS